VLECSENRCGPFVTNVVVTQVELRESKITTQTISQRDSATASEKIATQVELGERGIPSKFCSDQNSRVISQTTGGHSEIAQRETSCQPLHADQVGRILPDVFVHRTVKIQSVQTVTISQCCPKRIENATLLLWCHSGSPSG
jgi:hypothetical protein